MYYFTTYFDKGYLSRGLCVWESLQKFLPNQFQLFVLALDEEVFDFFTKNKNEFQAVVPIKLTDLEAYDKELLVAKETRKKVEYYFTLSPCLPLYVLEKYQNVDMITYIDADIYFFQSPKIIFDELGANSALIVPHRFSEKNKVQEMHGIYNVVFNTFRRDENGLKLLHWWREKCIEWCFDYVEGDKFADQKYLEKFSQIIDNLVITKNKGVNLAVFNLDNGIITEKNKAIYVDEDKLVFYHFHNFKKIHQYLFDGSLELTNQNKKIVKVYLFYIKRLAYFEDKFRLALGNSTRYYKNSSKQELLDKLIFEYLIVQYPLYQGIIHLEPLYNGYKKIKNIFKSKLP